MPKRKPPAAVLSSTGGTGHTTAAHSTVLDFIECGQRVQAAVDAIVDEHSRRGRPKKPICKKCQALEKRAKFWRDLAGRYKASIDRIYGPSGRKKGG